MNKLQEQLDAVLRAREQLDGACSALREACKDLRKCLCLAMYGANDSMKSTPELLDEFRFLARSRRNKFRREPSRDMEGLERKFQEADKAYDTAKREHDELVAKLEEMVRKAVPKHEIAAAGAYAKFTENAAAAIRPFCTDDEEAESVARMLDRATSLHATLGSQFGAGDAIGRARRLIDAAQELQKFTAAAR